MGKAVSSILGIEQPKAPEPVQIPTPPQAAAEPRQDTVDLPDNKAITVAKDRLEELKRRRGRSSLRQDLAVSPSMGVGAGIAIPR